ncbi:MAG: thioredoxin domain-containing protein [bacterium]|nr:thioredoxin domain-containing protein [bacterium]
MKSGKQKQQQQQTFLLVGGVVAAAVVVFVAIVAFSQTAIAERSGIDFSQLETNRTSDGAFVLGDPNAPITVVEFADFLCPHCQDYKDTVNQFIEEFVVTGKARLEFRLIANLGADSTQYAKLAECAADQSENDSNFWVAHEELFYYATSQRMSGDQAGRELAKKLNLNLSRLLECTQEADQYQTDMALARTAGTSGTPAIRIRLGTFAETQNTTPQPISPNYASGGVSIDVLRTTVNNANQ